MTPFAANVMRFGLDLAQAARTVQQTPVDPPLSDQLRLSQIAEQMAQQLFAAAAILMPSWRLGDTAWAATDERLRDHFRRMAEVAIIQLDQLSVNRARSRAVHATACDMELETTRDEVIAEEGARRGIVAYQDALSRAWRERSTT